MEMNYLFTVWLQVSVGDELFQELRERVFFIFLPTMHFGVLSQIFNIGSLFILGCQPCDKINDSHGEGKLPQDCNEIN